MVPPQGSEQHPCGRDSSDIEAHDDSDLLSSSNSRGQRSEGEQREPLGPLHCEVTLPPELPSEHIISSSGKRGVDGVSDEAECHGGDPNQRGCSHEKHEQAFDDATLKQQDTAHV